LDEISVTNNYEIAVFHFNMCQEFMLASARSQTVLCLKFSAHQFRKTCNSLSLIKNIGADIFIYRFYYHQLCLR